MNPESSPQPTESLHNKVNRLLGALHRFAFDRGYKTKEGKGDNITFLKDCKDGKANPDDCQSYKTLADELQSTLMSAYGKKPEPKPEEPEQEELKKAA